MKNVNFGYQNELRRYNKQQEPDGLRIDTVIVIFGVCVVIAWVIGGWGFAA